MKEHECKPLDFCICSTTALEPDEKCPIHGGASEYPARCYTCGKFIKTKNEVCNKIEKLDLPLLPEWSVEMHIPKIQDKINEIIEVLNER